MAYYHIIIATTTIIIDTDKFYSTDHDIIITLDGNYFTKHKCISRNQQMLHKPHQNVSKIRYCVFPTCINIESQNPILCRPNLHKHWKSKT